MSELPDQCTLPCPAPSKPLRILSPPVEAPSQRGCVLTKSFKRMFIPALITITNALPLNPMPLLKDQSSLSSLSRTVAIREILSKVVHPGFRKRPRSISSIGPDLFLSQHKNERMPRPFSFYVLYMNTYTQVNRLDQGSRSHSLRLSIIRYFGNGIVLDPDLVGTLLCHPFPIRPR